MCVNEIVDWLDNSRDLIKMFTVFDIPQPVIGIGHSMGGAQTYLTHNPVELKLDSTQQFVNQVYSQQSSELTQSLNIPKCLST